MRVLVIEDNPRIAAGLQRGLTEHGFQVDVAALGYEGEEKAAGEEYDTILLDVMLPDVDGVQVCRNLRRMGVSTPVLMLTALSSTGDKVAGLDAGADDYVTKPFQFEELAARIRALLRRGLPTEAVRLKYADLEMDLARRTVHRAGQSVRLTAREFSLLECLMRHPDEVLAKTVIFEKVWDMNYEPASNVLEVYVSNLRRKIDRKFDPALIQTVVGCGYRLSATVDA